MLFDVLIKEGTVVGRFFVETLAQLLCEHALQHVDRDEIQYNPN
jgi:hypothetical protein